MVVKARRSFAESPVAESDRAALTVDAIRVLDRAAAKGKKGAAPAPAPAPAKPDKKGKK